MRKPTENDLRSPVGSDYNSQENESNKNQMDEPSVRVIKKSDPFRQQRQSEVSTSQIRGQKHIRKLITSAATRE